MFATADTRTAKLHIVARGGALCGAEVTRYATPQEEAAKKMCFFCDNGLAGGAQADALADLRPDHRDWIVDALLDGTVTYKVDGALIIIGTSGDIYATEGKHCSCPAGGKGKPCKHLAFAEFTG